MAGIALAFRVPELKLVPEMAGCGNVYPYKVIRRRGKYQPFVLGSEEGVTDGADNNILRILCAKQL